MTRTIWLASYPKSGNTWFRMLVANLSATTASRSTSTICRNAAASPARAARSII